MRPLVRLDGGVSLRLALPGPLGAPAWEVRALARDEVEAVLGSTRSLAVQIADLDLVAPRGWRCFVAFDGGRAIHASFVEIRPGRPLLFGSITCEGERGRGAFRATVGRIAEALSNAGEGALYSSTSRSNRASLRAHKAAGFVVVSRSIDVVVLGVSLRRLARMLVRRD